MCQNDHCDNGLETLEFIFFLTPFHDMAVPQTCMGMIYKIPQKWPIVFIQYVKCMSLNLIWNI